MYTVKDICQEFKNLLSSKTFVNVNREKTLTDLTGNTVIEILGASFIADQDAIFGKVNWEYVRKEEEWYKSLSLNVNDFPGGAPQIWKSVADKNGKINSNYGALIYSSWNGNQLTHVFEELKKNPESRRALAIYTRPTIWDDYNKNGMQDFICTNTVQYLIRDGKLNAVVQMRSNDAVFGYKNDRAWQYYILTELCKLLNVDVGNIIWQVGSLHIYERHYYLVDPNGYKKL